MTDTAKGHCARGVHADTVSTKPSPTDYEWLMDQIAETLDAADAQFSDSRRAKGASR